MHTLSQRRSSDEERHCIGVQGPAAELSALLPALQRLDLATNLFTTWQFALELSAALPALAHLTLSENPMTLPTTVPAGVPPANLRVLVMNSCSVTWPQARFSSQL